tara:strand:- start:562 stop:732 length:171 start_codon:yes stop_codon:yes gene_type:complete
MTAVHFSGFKDTFQQAYLWASQESERKSVVALSVRFLEEHGKWQGVLEFNVDMSET